ncbi:mannitol-1-phosphate 5-dehydrogenase [Halobacillus yeomjeoni]|uniref:Mannitol-1-phosphate 5-dehydrogenase n=1 Tax=Halobacillus yeomjeoni TaxID=311194 RepID=A0A931MWJ7_9BACI|nr:mannitol-1-phosphate 5-dehydrogenase [Halobacillus yeomjeoni]MBH0231361.1 mannitol-1-phosphate 5-dehydrogenase [Halobacillus yeomjeoni]
MKALHFGAGNIGKGLIGYLLNKSGYDVCFVDVNDTAVERINENHNYLLEIIDENRTVETISPVRALDGKSQDDVADAIVDADLITTSVGANNLSKIAPVLSKGLAKRVHLGKNKVDLIANENMIDASSALKEEIRKNVSEEEMDTLLSHVGFPNSAIDRLSLSEEREEGERTLVEPYYEWLIEKSGMKNPDLPLIKDATYVETLESFIERKLYIVNLGHAATAYKGFLEGYPTIQSALKNPQIEKFLKAILLESARYLIEKHNFASKEMCDFIEQTIKRFKNENISDEVTRVGRAPIRKLGANERLVKPTVELFQKGYQVENLSIAVASAFLFDYPEDEESITLQAYIHEHGIDEAIAHFTGIEESALRTKIKENYFRLQEDKTIVTSNER